MTIIRSVALTLLLASMISGPALAQQTGSAAPATPPDCSSDQHRAFDFWVGEWRVYSGDTVAGKNTISKRLDGCVLQEHWRGAQGSRGTSLNFFNRADGLWHQVWIDARGGVLSLSGGVDDRGRMVLSGTRQQTAPASVDSAATAESVTIEHRITWSPQPDGSVNQHWQNRPEGGEWQTLFNGDYRPRSKN